MLKSQYTIPSILKTTEDNKKTKINVKKIKSIKKKNCTNSTIITNLIFRKL